MTGFRFTPSTLFFGCAAIFLLFFSTPVAAFGAGNIVSVSKIAGKNWRHGDIEDVLLELFMSKAGNTKFDSLAVKRVYFVCIPGLLLAVLFLAFVLVPEFVRIHATSWHFEEQERMTEKSKANRMK
jgi:hypothetical protein